MRSFRALFPLLGLILALPQVANASEVTRVASSFEEDNPFDLHFGVAYDYEFKRASLLREWSRTNGSNRLAKDLIYQRNRQTVTPRIEIGLFHDLSVYVDLPVVVSDDRNYSFDQNEPCVYPDALGSATGERTATCVNKYNSSTIRDAIVPRDGFDALNKTNPYRQFTGEDTRLIFRGPTRRGIDQLHVGIKKGLMNQGSQPHLPNWVIGVEGRFAVGQAMQFTRDIGIDTSGTAANEVVGRGVHELGAWTSLSHRHRFLEPFFGAHWRQSIRASGSQFVRYRGAVDKVNPMSTAGFFVGSEVVPWERRASKQKVAFSFAGSANLRYGGREYSELWEILSDSPALVGTYRPATEECNEAASLAYAKDYPTDAVGYIESANQGGGGCQKFNGITTVQNYARFAMRLSLNFHLSAYARLMLGLNLGTSTRHFLSAADRGDPEIAGDSDVVDADSADVNPYRRDVIDNVGRRYAIDDEVDAVGFARFWLTF
ncbi:MAG: hypothetical protein V3V08_04890 [Nannocystaceae bacterium]